MLVFGGLMQLFPLQQPPGHEVASQTHAPAAPAQCWPTGQVPPFPHRHWPLKLQLLLRIGSHVLQTCPLLPHWLSVGGLTQPEPAQQPSGQVILLHPAHCWLLQEFPPPHTAHAWPFFPHWVWVLPG